MLRIPSQPTTASATPASSSIANAASSRVRTRSTLKRCNSGNLPSRHLRREHIPDPPLRADVLRMLGIRLDLSAKAKNEHVDGPVEDFGFEAARLFEQLIARPHPLRLSNKGFQQAKLGLRQGAG